MCEKMGRVVGKKFTMHKWDRSRKMLNEQLTTLKQAIMCVCFLCMSIWHSMGESEWEREKFLPFFQLLLFFIVGLKRSYNDVSKTKQMDDCDQTYEEKEKIYDKNAWHQFWRTHSWKIEKLWNSEQPS